MGAAGAGRRELHLRAWVGLPDGSAWLSDELYGSVEDPPALARAMAGRLRTAGAEALLARAGEMTGV